MAEGFGRKCVNGGGIGEDLGAKAARNAWADDGVDEASADASDASVNGCQTRDRRGSDGCVDGCKLLRLNREGGLCGLSAYFC
jgi:hypothetical protein